MLKPDSSVIEITFPWQRLEEPEDQLFSTFSEAHFTKKKKKRHLKDVEDTTSGSLRLQLSKTQLKGEEAKR